MNKNRSYRIIIAQFLLVWMCSIIISGVIFMHKEITAQGEFVTHIHPYDLGEKKHHKHHSDAEIRFLDIVFQGSYLNWSPFVYESPIQQILSYIDFAQKTFSEVKQPLHCAGGRAPPIHLA